jgi:hypothetical protein
LIGFIEGVGGFLPNIEAATQFEGIIEELFSGETKLSDAEL